jgi:colanic acid/amylovoran biosynthesis glycosyltransferase
MDIEVMKIAYLINQYPKVSHTFIRREINALEALGLSVRRIAIRGWTEQLVDDLDIRERAVTHYILKTSLIKFVIDVLVIGVTRPIRFFRAMSEALMLARKSDRPRFYHLIYLVEACVVTRYCEDNAIHHIHAHFGTNPAEVALLAHIIGSLTFSFTVHGPDEFDCPEFLGLGSKIRAASFVAAISYYTRSQLMRWADHRDWSKIHVIRCGLDDRYFSNTRTPSQNENRFVSVARLSRQKGQLVLLQAISLLVNEGQSINLVLVGDGELRDDIERSIDLLGIRSNVVITGWLSNDAVRTEIENSRALVLSSFAEGLPVVLMEAMAMGRPVLTSSVAGITELVRSGSEGWVYPPSSVEAIASALRECLAAPPETIDEIGQRAKLRCAEFHMIDKSAACLLGLFNSIV